MAKLRNDFRVREEELERLVTQEWSGVEVRESCGNRGRGVISTREFGKGDIILDYHARQIPEHEGESLLISEDDSDRRSDYIFFGPRGFCLDGSAECCPCHPQTRTLGRLMNYVEKSTPECYVVPGYFAYNKARKILFVASRDIQPLEELRFDYGDKHFDNVFSIFS